ncbi:hypothetical protein ACIHFB_23640 [Streptomyces sp. NPDC051963]|uniref:hypothetical protein n=1 Tax=Streptomyces sp. NPDC051963 TaxID=3365678 RepID=UPI0037CEE507
MQPSRPDRLFPTRPPRVLDFPGADAGGGRLAMDGIFKRDSQRQRALTDSVRAL